MIEEFVEAWERSKHELEEKFQQKHPGDYVDIVRGVVEILNPKGDYGSPDPTRITVIDQLILYQVTLIVIRCQVTFLFNFVFLT